MSLCDAKGHRVAIKRQVMVVNEEGLRRELPYNSLASVLAGRRIFGDVLICYRSQIPIKTIQAIAVLAIRLPDELVVFAEQAVGALQGLPRAARHPYI